MTEILGLEGIRKVYMVGIKGSGMIALVEILHALGKEVIGSDIDEKFFTDATLQKLKIRYHEGFDVQNISKEQGIDLVIRSTVYTSENNTEVEYAQKNELKTLTYPEFIGLFSQNKNTIAVCGTHGKTTTSALLTLALRECGADPTAIIGSKVKQLDASTVMGRSDYLVVEADEYQNKLASYYPFGVVLLNADYDHPDFFKSFEDYKKVFEEFIKKIPKEGFLVVCGNDRDALDIARCAKCKVIVYGFLDDNKEHEIGEVLAGEEVKEIEFFRTSKELRVGTPGDHNRLNASAALAVCKQLGFDSTKAKKAIADYAGVSRRMEKIGTKNGALIIDDYAHHPAEIVATLSAIREKFESKNIICVFHPHTFTRTKALIDDFAESFSDADEVIILDIYGSAREKQGGVCSQEIVSKAEKFHDKIKHIATIEQAYEDLKDRIGEDDLVLTMGAGDVDSLGRMLVNK